MRIRRIVPTPTGSEDRLVRPGGRAPASPTRARAEVDGDGRWGAFAGQLRHLFLRRAARHAVVRSVAGVRTDAAAADGTSAEAPAPELFERAVEAAGIGTWECTLPDEKLVWSGVTYDIFGLPRSHRLERRDALAFYPRACLATLLETRQRALETGAGFTLDTEIVSVSGSRRWMRITATVDHDGHGPRRLFGLKQDITEEKLLLRKAQYLAEFDAMTGIANRTRFEAGLAALCQEAGPPGRPGALMLIDLDGFKLINDTFGHSAGDASLREAAARLSKACEGAGMVSRVGGDEFAVLVPPGSDMACTEALAARIVAALAEPMERDGISLGFSASVGIAAALGGTPRELFTQADAALYEAKDAGRNTYRIFAPPTLG